MNTPYVSIITITYNHERFIKECIESVLNQAFENWEQIIIDDCSTDKTVEIVASYEDPRIKLIVQDHAGPFSLRETYNKALTMAKGKYIAILEGDDFWPSCSLKEHVSNLSKSNYCLSHGLSSRTNSKGAVIGSCSVPPMGIRSNDPVGVVTKHLLYGNNFSHTSTLVIRRKELEEIGGFQGCQSLPTIDIPTLLELGMKGRFIYNEKVLGFHRKHSESVAHKYASEDENGYIQNLKRYCLSFYEANKKEEMLINVSRNALEKAWNEILLRESLGYGREALMLHQWKRARSNFKRAIRSKNMSYSTSATFGYVFSILHMSILERVIKLVKGHNIKDLLEE